MKIKPVHKELFLYFMFNSVYVNIIGSISLSELWVLVVAPFLITKKSILKNPAVRRISIIFLLYFLSQCLSEIVTNNSFNNSIRGLMVTVMSYLTTIYLFDRLGKNISFIPYIYFFLVINYILNVNKAGLGEDGVEFGIQTSSFFKYKITPILSSLILFVSYFLLKWKYRKTTILILGLLIVSYINFSARSSALFLFFTVLIMLFGNWLSKNRHTLIPSLAIILVLSYGAYVIWVDYQLEGDLAIKNTQVENLENPYNPFELLSAGRTEFLVGMVAFQDNFLWGNGSWAKDKGLKYSIMLQELKNKEKINYNIISQNDKIPSHSVIIGAGVYNGVFALLLISYLIIYVIKLKLSVFSYLINTPFSVIYSFNIIVLLWTVLFSPLAHLRLGLPLVFSLALIFHSYFKQKHNIKIN